MYEYYTSQMRAMIDWALSSLNKSREELLDVCFVTYFELYVRLFRQSTKSGCQFILEFAPAFESKFGHFIDQIADFKRVDQLTTSPLFRLQHRNKKHLIVISKRAKRSLLSWIGYNQGSLIEHILQESVSFIDGEVLNRPDVHFFRTHFIKEYGLHPESVRKFNKPFLGLYVRDYDNEIKIDKVKTNLLIDPQSKHYVPLGLPGELHAEDPHSDFGHEAAETITGEVAHLEYFYNLVPLPRPGTDVHQYLRGLYHVQKEHRATGKAPTTLSYTFQNSFPSCCCSISSFDGRYASLGLNDGSVLLWDLVASESSNAFKDLSPVLGENIAGRSISRVTGSSASKFHASGEGDEMAAGGLDSMLMFGHDGPVSSLCFGEMGRVLLSGGVDGDVRLRTLGSSSTRAIYRGGGHAVLSLKYGPYGYYFSTCEADGSVRVWETDRSFPLRILRTSNGELSGTFFHPNSTLLGTPCSDGNVRIWDLRTSCCEIVLPVSEDGSQFDSLHFNELAFSKNGAMVASALKNIVQVFDLRTKRNLQTLLGHEDPIVSMDFNHGSSVLVAADAGAVSFWDVKGNRSFGDEDDKFDQFSEEGMITLTSAYKPTDSLLRQVCFTPENVLLTLGVSTITATDNM
ncbi:WD domain, G-beta repeat domain-containing protein [Theileria equi strain WA]|uniref:WD domain, G-beta repeat domain-containing protein n=1 Tax=Theileria equi strain WA TaxID=1537102 RepID=L0B049_THEEQ|nr:WD domain, G-beta repeat domain-containing protein [Theileria equi strain WA]AFZ80873.1 WD domain, G-beta repeat domain-containing protein [Theileria equi strain WA]|eukprot:XP_004830539.1 WD domain, G-beta repeat domain-containing protein [Theileria equi strain WA]